MTKKPNYIFLNQNFGKNKIMNNQKIETLINKGNIQSMDVRDQLAGGSDPFKNIIDKLNSLPEGFVLEVINSFEPKPLITILNKKGYESEVITTPNEIKTYFLKVGEKNQPSTTQEIVNYVSAKELEFEQLKFKNKCIEIDVRDMEMPMPMVTILNQLESLTKNNALFVNHKKIPQMLLPELEERGFRTWIADIEEGNVKLLITH